MSDHTSTRPLGQLTRAVDSLPPGSEDRVRHVAANDNEGSDSEDDDDEHQADENQQALLPESPNGTYDRGINGVLSQLSAPPVSPWYFVRSLVVETAPTLFITIVGMIFTGELFERVSRWTALRSSDELVFLIPIVNNLKGNLEMNLSARLGTAASLGYLGKRQARLPLIQGNLLLLQVQALLVSAVAAFIAFLLARVLPPLEKMPLEMPQDSPPPNMSAIALNAVRRTILRVDHAAMNEGTGTLDLLSGRSILREFASALTTAMTSASLSGLILGTFMCSLVLICQHLSLNPDNIAPPVASCLGDLLTLTLLALTSTALLHLPSPIPFLFLLALLGFAGVAFRAARKSEITRPLLSSGWSPLFGAMIISSGTGLVLERFVRKYEGFGLMSVVISGLPGSVGAVSISRLSTLLHSASDLPSAVEGIKFRPIKHAPQSRRSFLTALALFAVAVPVQLAFVGIVYWFGWMDLPFTFVASFFFFFCLSVCISLVLAEILTLSFWEQGWDPDNYCLPLHSALCDLLGQLLLVACYEFVAKMGADVDL